MGTWGADEDTFLHFLFTHDCAGWLNASLRWLEEGKLVWSGKMQQGKEGSR